MPNSKVTISAELALDAAQARGDFDKFKDGVKDVAAKLRLDTTAAKADADKLRMDESRKSITEKIKLDDSGTQAKLLALKANIDSTIGRLTISPDVDSKKALATATDLRLRIDRELKKAGVVNVDLRTDRATAQMAAFDAKAAALSEIGGEESGRSFGGGFSLVSPEVLVPAITASLVVVPGLFAAAGGLGAVALGTALAVKGSPALQAAGKSLLSDLENTMTGAASVLDQPVSDAITDIQGQVPTIGKLFRSMFTDVAPEIRPVADMLTTITEDTLPGFNELMRESAAPLSAFFRTSGQIVGTGLGSFFKDLGPGAASSLGDIEGLERALFGLLDGAAKVGSAYSGVFGSIGKASQGTPLGGIFSTVKSFSSFMDKHLGSENIFQKLGLESNPAENTATKSISNSRSALINLLATEGKAAGQSTSLRTAAAQITTQLNKQHSATTGAMSALETYFGVLGDSQSALSGVASEISDANSAIKKYGAGSTQAATAITTLMTSNASTMADLAKQNAPLSTQAKIFEDMARSQLGTAASSTVLQGALVLQAQAAGLNVTNWAGLKKILDDGTGGINNAQSALSKLTAGQEDNAAKAANMQRANDQLAKTLAQTEQAGQITKGQVSDLTEAMKLNVGQVDDSKSAFVKFAGQLGISKGKADNLWTSLSKVAGTYAANVKVSVTGGGKIKVQGDVAVDESTGISTSLKTGEQSFNGYAYASGGIVRGPGSAGRDSVLARLAPGELIIPTSHAAHFGAAAKAAGIPGFAAGGLIGQAGATFSQAGSVSSALSAAAEPGFSNATGTQLTNQFGAVLQSALKSAASTLTSGTLSGAAPVTSAVLVQLIAEALNKDSAPASWLPAIELIISKESGGNALAVDPIAVMGEHATGLMQMLPTTYAMYGPPGGILNPLDSLIAGIKHIEAAWGSPFNIPGIGRAGTYKGYSTGGTINEPVFGHGAWSGLPYSFGENGPEVVSNAGQVAAQSQGMPGATNIGQQTIIQQNSTIIKLLQQVPRAMGRQINGAAVNGFRTGYYHGG